MTFLSKVVAYYIRENLILPIILERENSERLLIKILSKAFCEDIRSNCQNITEIITMVCRSKMPVYLFIEECHFFRVKIKIESFIHSTCSIFWVILINFTIV